MIIQLMMCIRNAYLKQSLPVVNHDVVTRRNNGATFDVPIPRIGHLRKTPILGVSNMELLALRNQNKGQQGYMLLKNYIIQGLIDNTLRAEFPF